MNKLRRLVSTALLGLAMVGGATVAQPLAVETAAAQQLQGTLYPVWDTNGNLIGFIFVPAAQETQAQTQTA